MSMPFKRATTDLTLYFGNPASLEGLAHHVMYWERGAWLITHQEHGGIRMWTHRLCLYPLMMGKVGRSMIPNHKPTYAETKISPDFRTENGAVAAILYARVLQWMAEVDDFHVVEQWQAIADELEWSHNTDLLMSDERGGTDLRADRCFVNIALAQHWLKEKGTP